MLQVARRLLVAVIPLAVGLVVAAPGCGRSPLEDEDLIGGDGAAGKGGSGKGGSGGSGVGGTSVGGGGSGGVNVGGGGTGGIGAAGAGGFGAGGGGFGGGGLGGFGGSPGCGPCTGCCDAAGVCRKGDETNACGKDGVACFDCGSIGFGCVGSTCEGPPPKCGPGNCSGCCDQAGICRSGVEADACGAGGKVCSNCLSAGQGCSAGVCQGPVPTCGPGTCSGCCDAGGKCLVGGSNSACGTGGKACVVCQPPTKCSEPGHYCAYIPTCGPLTCPDGCCDAQGQCQDGNKNAACGVNGQSCTDCTKSGLNCAPQGFCYSGPHCGPDNCAGCCDATGQCRPGSQAAFCGQFGQLCDNCTQKNANCVGQVCATGSTCPAPYAGCPPSSVTPPPASFKACSTQQLSAIGSACKGQGGNPACGDAFQQLLGSDPACYDCLIQFATDLAYARCLAPFLSATCNHELTCALQCSNVSCGQCPPFAQESCSDTVFGQGGACRPHINGYFCAEAALSGPGSFCEFKGDTGAWIQSVGNFYCGGG